MARLTPRMINWLTGLGAHIATASKEGVPRVAVVDSAHIESESIAYFPLSEKQKAYLAANLKENPRVAIGPGGIGSIRAAYQFKGAGHIEDDELVVAIDEIYSTKPGPEAGLRLDVLPYNEIIAFERSRWRDDGPPKA